MQREETNVLAVAGSFWEHWKERRLWVEIRKELEVPWFQVGT
jgi:hypothetical protein